MSRWMRLGSEVLALLSIALATGCSTGEFEDIQQRMQNALETRVVVGKVRFETGDRLCVLVVALRHTPAGLVAEAAAQAYGTGSYGMGVVAGERYTIVGFADRNGNYRLDAGEPVGIAAAVLDAGAHGPMGRRDLDLVASTALPADVERALREVPRLEQQPETLAAGDVLPIDDEKFSAEYATRGLWQPDRFLATVGAGVFFLEPYDPAKRTVLFVSGAGGFPQQWLPILHFLDHDRYQPCVFLYASGARLDASVRLLDRALRKMRRRYHVERISVVAHSMGGLVARAWILRAQESAGESLVDSFISISTPWRGHEAAGFGADLPGGPIPAWVDLRSDSEYQTALFSRQLPESVAYLLLYSYGGKKNPLLPDNDGTVTIASQLRAEARADALRVAGFDEGHVSILSSPSVARTVERFLDEPRAPGEGSSGFRRPRP